MSSQGRGERTREQRMEIALQTWVDNPLLPLDEVAHLANISAKTFYRYRQEPQFMEEYHRRCQARFKSLEGKAVELLDEQLNIKNWNAIKFALENMGYKPTEKIEQVNETTIKVSVDED